MKLDKSVEIWFTVRLTRWVEYVGPEKSRQKFHAVIFKVHVI